LLKLAAVSAVDCSMAEVIIVQMKEGPAADQHQQQLDLQGLLLHVQAAQLAALDLVIGPTTAACSSRGGGSSQQLLLVQWLVPSATMEHLGKCWPATIYAVVMPEQQQGLKLAQLQQVLEDSHIIKVIHDARSAAKLLLQQHDIQLNAVLDTQLLAGVAALAAAASSASGEGSRSSTVRANGQCSSSGGSGAARRSDWLRRASLTELYRAYSYPLPEDEEGWSRLGSTPR
jgi:hypothetical protein